MIRINLLPVKEQQAENLRRKQLTVGGAVLGAALLVMGGFYYMQYSEFGRLEKEMADLRNDILALNIKVKEVGDLQNKIKDLRSKNKIFEDLSKKRIGPVRVLESISTATPTSLWLTELKETGGNITLTGLAMDNQTIADFMRALADSKHFTNVDLVEVVQERATGTPLKKFSIKSAVLYQPAEVKPVEAKSSGPAVKKQERKG